MSLLNEFKNWVKGVSGKYDWLAKSLLVFRENSRCKSRRPSSALTHVYVHVMCHVVKTLKWRKSANWWLFTMDGLKKWTFLTEENLSDPTLKPLEWLSFCNNTLNFPQAGTLEKGLLVVTCPSAGAQVLTKIIKIKAVETVTKLSKT